MPDQVAVPGWLIDIWNGLMDVTPDVAVGDTVIPDWLVFFGILGIALGLLSGWSQAVQRRRDREALARAITEREDRAQ